jgi:phosphatidylinositol alpha-mannosyltransferase
VSLSFLGSRTAAPHTAFIATFHEYRSSRSPIFDLGKPLWRRWVNRLDGRIAVSTAALAFNQLYFPGDYTIIPNGVDVARFASPRPDEDARAHQVPTILFVGRLEERKGFWHLLHAFEQVKPQLPTLRLLVVGAYTDAATAPFSQYIARRQLSDVEFIGQVSDGALPAYYQAADIFCAPSVDFESFGIVLLEAMAAGTPIIASDLPGYRTILQQGQQGLLVEPANSTALAAALLSLLYDRQRRQVMGEAGRATAQMFDWKLVSARILQFYREMVAG